MQATTWGGFILGREDRMWTWGHKLTVMDIIPRSHKILFSTRVPPGEGSVGGWDE